MPQALYRVHNATGVTTAAPVKVATGTTIKTLLQVKSSGLPLSVIAWGISFDDSAAATPIEVELLDTGTVAATVTTSAAGDIIQLTDPGGTAAALTLGTAATGFSASAEGTITATRLLDAQLVAPTNQYIYQFPLGQEPNIIPANYLRIRVTAAASVGAYCWIIFSQG